MPAPEDPQLRSLPQDRADAVHRALLTGLLGNVGYRSEAHEYTGARGVKFHLFPGSGLFKHPPKWVMAGEVVETTRLYARTVAAVQPEWVERAAQHLVQPDYADPHWDATTAHVRAFERVTLYGLTLVPRRRVHYGPIAPREARDIFVRGALVRGEYRSNAPFLAHNLALVERVRGLEAKLRQRDLLASEEARYAFFDNRVPQGVYSGPLFERWRRDGERADPKLLFMSLSDVMARPAAYREEDYPDELRLDGLTLPLEYRFDPGGPMDGITAHVPLAVVNQLPPERFEWLVPGWLKEKIVELIRALPKAVRVNFIGASKFAEAAAERMTFGECRLADALSRTLGQMAGVTIPRDAWRPEELPPHLRMNFRVVDEAGRLVAAGRDLAAIQAELRGKAAATFADIDSPWNRRGVTAWDFGDLPESVQVKHRGMSVVGYPAAVDEDESVSLRLMDTPGKAREANRAGVRRLFMLQVPQELDHVMQALPPADLREMCLHYATLGPYDRLKQDLLAATVERVFLGERPPVRTHEEFELRLRGHWHHLIGAGREVAELAKLILSSYQRVAVRLEGDVPLLLQPAVEDVKEQIAHLLPPGFLADTPWGWLKQFPRYLRAAELRLHKVSQAGLTRDNKAASVLTPLWLRYLQTRDRQRDAGVHDPALELYRWMLEELRVSLFAQELGTAMPISPKRLEQQWELVRK